MAKLKKISTSLKEKPIKKVEPKKNTKAKGAVKNKIVKPKVIKIKKISQSQAIKTEDKELEKQIGEDYQKDKRGLSIRELLFIKFHLLGLTNELSASKAGYSKKSAGAIACTLLNRAPVIKEIKKRVKGIVNRADEKIAQLIENLQIDAYYLTLDVVDSNGKLRPRKQLGIYERVICDIETKLNAKGDKYTVVKLANRDKAREKLGRYYQMFTDKVELTGGLTLNIGKPPEAGNVDDNSTETAEPIKIDIGDPK